MIGFRIASMIAGVCAISATAMADETVKLSPRPGFTIDIPKGWKSCTEVVDTQLGTAEDPLALSKQLCPVAASAPGVNLAVYWPKVGYTASVMFGYSDTSPITPELIVGLTPEMLTQVADAVRTEKEALLSKSGSKLDNVSVRADKIGGQAALVTTLLITPKEGALAQAYSETWEVPVGGRMHQISFAWSKLLESNTKPTLEAIKASVELKPAS
jgi:hypothetical protein